MRLEQHEQPATVAHRGERRGDLGRMVRVVVEDFDAPGLAAAFQAPSRAGELGKYRLGLAAPHSGQLECGYGASGIATVVFAGDSERPIVWRQMISPHDALRRNRCEPVFKELLDLRTRRERRVVIEIDVRNDGDVRAQQGDGAIRFVALDDKPAFAGACVAAKLRNVAADEPGRITAERVKAKRDHRRRCGFAVRTGNHDRRA